MFRAPVATRCIIRCGLTLSKYADERLSALHNAKSHRSSVPLEALSFAEQTRDVLLEESQRLKAAGKVKKARQVLAKIEEIETKMRALEVDVRRRRLH